MDQTKLRAWWSHRQGLDGRLSGKPAAQVLEETGWMRSVGGSGPYLGLWARCGADRAAIDHDLAALEIHELPSARGCTYVLPKLDFALGLFAGQPFGGGALSTARKLGVTDGELATLCEAVRSALAKGPREPDELRAATGTAARSLGEAGKKKGLTTTLPLALGKLQQEGVIRRVPVNGRLDQQRYKYTLWSPNPLQNFALGSAPDQVQTELAKRYFKWAGPATLAQFQWFSALGVKAAKAAIAPLQLVPLTADSDLLLLPEHHDELQSFTVPKEPQFVLVSGIDGIALLRRDLAGITDAADRERKWPAGQQMMAGSLLKDLETHAIMDRGRLVGLWVFDPERGKVAWTSFIKKNSELTAAVARTEEFVRQDLGDARSFSLDSPASRAPMIAALGNM